MRLSMDEQRFNLWVKRILETEQDEISCSECFDLISSFVDQENSGNQTDQIAVRVVAHLKQCQACSDEYEMLRELTGLEAARQLPTLNNLLNSIHPDTSQ